MVLATLCDRLPNGATPAEAVAVSVPWRVPVPLNTAAVTIVVLSVVEDLLIGYEVGIDSYLRKPIDSAMLLYEVEGLLGAGMVGRPVLVVDDDAATAGRVATIFRQQGYAPVEVADSQTYMARAQMIRPHVVVAPTAFAEQFKLVERLRFEKGGDTIMFYLFENGKN